MKWGGERVRIKDSSPCHCISAENHCPTIRWGSHFIGRCHRWVITKLCYSWMALTAGVGIISSKLNYTLFFTFYWSYFCYTFFFTYPSGIAIALVIYKCLCESVPGEEKQWPSQQLLSNTKEIDPQQPRLSVMLKMEVLPHLVGCRFSTSEI